MGNFFSSSCDSPRLHLEASGIRQCYSLGAVSSSQVSGSVQDVLGKRGKKDSEVLKVLDGVDLVIPEGEVLFLRGASGSGKSTLLYILAGLERPSAGVIKLEGEELYALSSSHLATIRNQRMGFIFQSYFLLPELTAFENIHLPALLSGKPRPERVASLLERIGLAERAAHLPSQMSGGEQQRVAIARALINEPPILFADEPTGNLDPVTGASIAELLLGIAREEGRTLVVVTHDPQLAAQGDRQIILEKGKIIESSLA
jgi:predicted ABC-type transport system involved in lysophospholipase L1 biosynthesis ATPase subunit